MTSSRRQRRLRLFVLLMLVALIGHLILEGAAIASTDHAGADADATSSAACVHSGLLLPSAIVLRLGLAPHPVLAALAPAGRGFRSPTQLHPPTGSLFC